MSWGFGSPHDHVAKNACACCRVVKVVDAVEGEADGLGSAPAGDGVGAGAFASRSFVSARLCVDALGLGVAAGPDGCGVAVGGLVALTGAPEPSARACRMRSNAVLPRIFSTWSRPLPGTEITMFLPSVETSDSATPRPLTRCRMMSTDLFSVLFVTLPWLWSIASGVRVTWVPPRRSRPSCGLVWPVPIITAYRPMTSSAVRAINRPLRAPRDEATGCALLVSRSALAQVGGSIAHQRPSV